MVKWGQGGWTKSKYTKDIHIELEPIRSELFGAERLRQHARSLALAQTVTSRTPNVKNLVDRLASNDALLLSAYRELCKNVSDGTTITPAAEWLIDNYHVVEEHVRQIRTDLTPGYYRQLPKLEHGHLAGYPRVYAIIWGYIAHTDSYFEPLTLAEYISEYQRTQPLSTGELWAVAISLRLILIENLRRICERIVISLRERLSADEVADQLTNPNKRDTISAAEVTDLIPKSFSVPYAVRLFQRVKGQEDSLQVAQNILQKRLEDIGLTVDEAIVTEHQRQNAANITVRNIVMSLKLIADVNWENWFDSVSLVDQILREQSRFGEMDFASRTLYRNAVEELARGSAQSELEIAGRALAVATEASTIDPQDRRKSDPGYYLIGKGRPGFEQQIGFRGPWKLRLRNFLRDKGLAAYVLPAFLITLIILSAGLFGILGMSVPIWIVLLLAVTAVLPILDVAIALHNYFLTRVLQPVNLPGFALRDGVPSELRTIVVIPTLLTSTFDIEELIHRLEVHYLANSDGELYFALLSDWLDSNTEVDPDDKTLLEAACTGINELNASYATNRFLLLHRTRRWNEVEKRWMGWERKRGKLHELNRVLLGSDETSISVEAGHLPSGVRFVITLDSDTELPREAARRMIGKMAHPLNSAIYDAKGARVVDGYGILQPRVTPSLPIDHYGSLYQRIFSTPRGLDPYAFTVSDIYQDLFAEGSYTGKGIYDVRVFELALKDRVPDNTMLSHDLFEGIYARSGLMTDIEVVEEHPEKYLVGAMRTHRWVRGDWQLLPWLIGMPGKNGAFKRSIPALGQWKLWDNIRRTVTPVSTLACLLIAWMLLPAGTANVWSLFIIAIGSLPPLFPTIRAMWHQRHGITLSSRLHSMAQDAVQTLALTFAHLIFLGHQTGLMLDAIIRTLFRTFVSHHKMLEWTTAAQARSNSSYSLFGHYNIMASSVAAGAITFAIIANRQDGIWISALPLALAWLVAPAAAYHISTASKIEDVFESNPEDERYLRTVARRTWRYFEKFVTVESNALPPDNYQEDPSGVIAQRTSPTNIGLYFLSAVSAREFGWIADEDALSRMEVTARTMEGLERHRGHLYNWYDTKTLVPLEPKYVSTVDSGNLAGHLIAAANSLENWINEAVDSATILNGLLDITQILRQELEAVKVTSRRIKPLQAEVSGLLTTFDRSVERKKSEPQYTSIRLIELAVLAANINASIEKLVKQSQGNAYSELASWIVVLRATIESHFSEAALSPEAILARASRLTLLASQLRRFANEMEFGFLVLQQRQLLSIGFRIDGNVLDDSCYDMLASEARLASYFAIAKGDVRTRHWFRLSRTTTAINAAAALISWSGSMFEYLMPPLVMRAPAGGLLDQTAKLIVLKQIDYARSLGVPWGISEAAFNVRDFEYTYQYSNFGVPGLGLKRGLSQNVVIAPYATGLASMVHPTAAAANYRRLAEAGVMGSYGFYEAIDFTPSRLPKDSKFAIVRAYFAHHQGMTIVAILNAVHGGLLRDRFHLEPRIRAAELLLQERAPRDVPVTHTRAEESGRAVAVQEFAPPPVRIIDMLSEASPSNTTHVLSNGELTSVVTGAGTGYLSWNGLRISRWHEDLVGDDWGTFFYLQDEKSGEKWSAGHMPMGSGWKNYTGQLTEDKIELMRVDNFFTTKMQIIVSTESAAEARRLTMKNTTSAPRVLTVTSYMELVLASPESDGAHPAFSKLFVETEFVSDLDLLIAHRRPRSSGDPEIWAGQFVTSTVPLQGKVEVETDRAKFIGFARNLKNPAALDGASRLLGTVGNVLDPIFSFRMSYKVEAGRQVSMTLWTIVSDSREGLFNLVDQHRQNSSYDRALTLAWTSAQINLRHLGVSLEDALTFQELAGNLIYASPLLRASPKTLAETTSPQSYLWPVGISGDNPIVLLRIDDEEDISVVKKLLLAHVYWASKGLVFDVVILNDRASSYIQDLQAAIAASINQAMSQTSGRRDKPHGRVFALRADQLASDVMRAIVSASRVVLYGRRGSLQTQMKRAKVGVMQTDLRTMSVTARHRRLSNIPRQGEDLQYFNGIGGFSRDGKEYIVKLSPETLPEAPWINVIANESFGFHASAEGGGYTWFGNSRENQLTRWTNDPVINRQSEVIYVKDEADGFLATPTFAPLQSPIGSHVARHGMGYTAYERDVHGLAMEMLQTVHLSEALKFTRLKVTNLTSTVRSISIVYYAEWVLGPPRSEARAQIQTEMLEQANAMLISNKWNNETPGNVVFVHMDENPQSWSGDRLEFLGAYGNLAHPAGLLSAKPLSNRTGAGLAPCVALKATIRLQPHETSYITIRTGAGHNRVEALALLDRSLKMPAMKALEETKRHWSAITSKAEVKSPDAAFNIMMNGWLLYQALSCRIYARSGFYQASGAFGFRDQLQDSLAFLDIKPELARQQIIRASSRQFEQGDFQHWWLPETGRGVRTRISDDKIWLAYCTAHYIQVTGDRSILDEQAPFLEGQEVPPHLHDVFFQPGMSETTATIFEHCALALDTSLATGDHGLPLIGTGDWNDGFNRVGAKGKGESVWLGWFLATTLRQFIPIASERNESDRVQRWSSHLEQLKSALEDSGWDGKWYRRGFFDDGSALGSATSEECKIDAIAQSWSVISGEGDKERAAAAMNESYQALVQESDKLMRLFTPAFREGGKDAGYVSAYPPGVRENGGQYTHGVIWSIFAFAKLNRTDRAYRLFSLFNPISHASSLKDARTYRVEPYAVAADIYSLDAHAGRGGWTWYTGSAGWLYRAGLEAILGIKRQNEELVLSPCLPEDWQDCEVSYHYRNTKYVISYSRRELSDRNVLVYTGDELRIKLVDDGMEHLVSIALPTSEQVSHARSRVASNH